MIPENSVWTRLKEGVQRGGGAVEETLRPWRAPIANYLRARRIGEQEADAHAGRVLGLIARTSFLESVDPKKVRFRPLMAALARHALTEAQPWVTLREDDADPNGLALEVAADPEFDRVWTLALMRAAVERLSREAPQLGEAIVRRYGRGDEAGPGLREARSRLRILIHSAVMGYSSSTEEFEKEVSELQRIPAGRDGYVELARELLGEAAREPAPVLMAPRSRVPLILAGAFAAGLAVATVVAIGWGGPDPEEPPREADPSAAHEAELAIARAALFVHHGRDPAGHDRTLVEAIGRLREVKPDSPEIATALCLRPGVAQDPGRFREAIAAAKGTEEGDVLAWDHFIYRKIAQAVWGGPVPAGAKPSGAPERIKADRALLAGENEQALDLYADLQRSRPGDPTVWLGGALAAWRAGSLTTAIHLADEAGGILVGTEGAKCAKALTDLCQAKAGGAESSPAVPGLSPGALVFRVAGETERAVPPAAASFIRARLAAAGLDQVSGVRVDPDALRLIVDVTDPDPETARRVEWLVTRRGVFSSRELAPRSENDQWTPPEAPPGCAWAELNLFYPAPPHVAGRSRLLREESPALAREHVEVTYDPDVKRLKWRCSDPGALPEGALLALLLDGEVFWYGKVDETRGGSLAVGIDTPQTLIPVIFQHGPLPASLERDR